MRSFVGDVNPEPHILTTTLLGVEASTKWVFSMHWRLYGSAGEALPTPWGAHCCAIGRLRSPGAVGEHGASRGQQSPFWAGAQVATSRVERRGAIFVAHPLLSFPSFPSRPPPLPCSSCLFPPLCFPSLVRGPFLRVFVFLLSRFSAHAAPLFWRRLEDTVLGGWGWCPLTLETGTRSS